MKILFWNIKRKGIQLVNELKKLSSDVDILIISELTENKNLLTKMGKTIQNVIDDISQKTNLVHVYGKEDSWLHVWYRESPNVEIKLVDVYNGLKSPSDITDLNVERDSEYFADYLNRYERMIFLKITFEKLTFLLVPIHFPSRLYASVRKQKDIAVHFRKFIEALESNHDLPSIVVGDFNMNPFEEGMIHHEAFHALPFQELDNSIKFYETPYTTFYNPTWEKFGDFEIVNQSIERKPAGSFYIKNSQDLNFYWYVLDQVILRKELIQNFQFEKFKYIYSINEKNDLLNDNLTPNDTVYSDHLPITFKIKQ